MKRYSQMNQDELFREMQYLLGEARKKFQAGFISEGNILEQKYFMAKSYCMDTKDFEAGVQYHVEGEEELYTIHYLNGIFAWGAFPSSAEEVAFPIGRLSKGEGQSCIGG